MIDAFNTDEHRRQPAASWSDANSGGTASIAETRIIDLPEQQHRTRNTLSVMRSVFTRTIEIGTSLEEVAAHYQGRFDTLAPFLTGSGMDEHGTYDLEMLVWGELQRYPVSGGEDVKVSGPSERLPYALAQPVALALHELATNTVKFGALDMPGQGHLAIEWWREDGDLILRWRETGVPIVRPAPLPFGFGREFIEQGLPYQIGAETSFAIEAGGVICTVRLPRTSGACMPSAPEGARS